VRKISHSLRACHLGLFAGRLNPAMDVSILLIGNENFLPTMLQRIRRHFSCTVETALNASEAMPLIQAQQPDLLVIQGEMPGGLELCQEIKAQTKLAWIYCLVIDIPAQTIPDGQFNREWEMDACSDALNNGADSYLLLPLADSNGNPLTIEQAVQQEQWLRSRIIAGFRAVKTYRELMRTNDILSAIALSDPLTELNNRRALDWELPRQIQGARTRFELLSVLMLDVDFFKRINDTYGHAVGDLTLQLVASRLRHNLRFRDTLFRYGGEEFVIILSCTDIVEADLVGRRLCHLIADQPFVIDETLGLNITVSAGAASLLQTDDSRGISLLNRADQNLLKAKASGRNQVVSGLETARTSDRQSQEDPDISDSKEDQIDPDMVDFKTL
jgi:two-component system cell cycle response regulator